MYLFMMHLHGESAGTIAGGRLLTNQMARQRAIDNPPSRQRVGKVSGGCGWVAAGQTSKACFAPSEAVLPTFVSSLAPALSPAARL